MKEEEGGLFGKVAKKGVQISVNQMEISFKYGTRLLEQQKNRCDNINNNSGNISILVAFYAIFEYDGW